MQPGPRRSAGQTEASTRVNHPDWIDEKKVVEHLGGGKSLGEIIGRNERIPVALARVDSDATQPGERIKPAQIAYFSPSIPDTLILSEISS